MVVMVAMVADGEGYAAKFAINSEQNSS